MLVVFTMVMRLKIMSVLLQHASVATDYGDWEWRDGDDRPCLSAMTPTIIMADFYDIGGYHGTDQDYMFTVCGPVCLRHCPNGFIKDRFGCPTCRCKPN